MAALLAPAEPSGSRTMRRLGRTLCPYTAAIAATIKHSVSLRFSITQKKAGNGLNGAISPTTKQIPRNTQQRAVWRPASYHR
jgi:hypothetical protein